MSVDAVIFDWGGTLTAWHDIDFHDEARVLAAAVAADPRGGTTPSCTPSAWPPHTLTDPQVGPLWRSLRERGIRVGVLSNTVWPREWHREFFARDGVLDLIGGDVYSSEIPWTKPSPEAFAAARRAVGVEDPARCGGARARRGRGDRRRLDPLT